MTPALKTIVFGSCGSQLALWQSEWVKKELQARFPALHIRIDIITATGDRVLNTPLSSLRAGEGKGLSTKELEQALAEHRIDCAVHSLEDLPTELPHGLIVGAITRRQDVRDVFIARPGLPWRCIEDLPGGATIATGGLRRRSQLLHWRPDLHIAELRGSLTTLDSSQWEGMVLARSGVEHLGLEARITQVIPLEKMLPAVGQGAIAIEIRQEDEQAYPELCSISSEATTIAARGERAFLRCLKGGCQVPLGAYGRIQHNEFLMDGFIGSLDGKTMIRGKIHGEPERAHELGSDLARSLSESGGRAILDMTRTAVL
jgi:hydroxymethylbilane synthase